MEFVLTEIHDDGATQRLITGDLDAVRSQVVEYLFDNRHNFTIFYQWSLVRQYSDEADDNDYSLLDVNGVELKGCLKKCDVADIVEIFF